MTVAIWKEGALIQSENITSRFSNAPEDVPAHLCNILGTITPKIYQEITKNQELFARVQKCLDRLNKNYDHICRGLPIEIPEGKTSVFSIPNNEEKKLLHMCFAVQGQELSWIKAALLKPSEQNQRIQQHVHGYLNLSLRNLYTLLDTSDEVTITKKQLVVLKSFIISNICLFRLSNSTTSYLTWDTALSVWTSSKKISETVVSGRVKEIQEKLSSISFLDRPPPDGATVTFSTSDNPSADTDYTSFRTFVGEVSAEYLHDLLNMPERFKKIVLPIFVEHDSLRLLVLHYCQRQQELKTTSKDSEQFLQKSFQELSPLLNLLVNDFFLILATKTKELQCDDAIRKKIQARPSKISNLYVQIKPYLDNQALSSISSFITNSYNLEKFCECVELYSAVNVQKSSVTVKQHALDIFFASSEIGRSVVKNYSTQWNDIQKAFLALESLETTYAFSVPEEDRLFFAYNYQCRQKTTEIITLFEYYSNFSKIFSSKVPLKRLEMLLTYDINDVLLSQYSQQTEMKEEEYIEVVKEVSSTPNFLVLLGDIIKNLKITPTFEEVILACKWGSKKNLSPDNLDTILLEIPTFSKKLEKHSFTNFQMIVISFEHISNQKVVKEHYESLETLEEYLRLTLPTNLAFSWLFFHEIPQNTMKTFVSELAQLRNLDALPIENRSEVDNLFSSQFKENKKLKEIPQVDIYYKKSIQLFCLRSLYNQELAFPSFFYPKKLPVTLVLEKPLFASSDPYTRYQASHQAVFSSWSACDDGCFKYSLYMMKNPVFMETYHSTFRLEITKKRFLELYESDEFVPAFLGKMLSHFLNDMSLLSRYTKSTHTATKEMDEKEIKEKFITALKSLMFSEKIINDKLLIAAIENYSQKYRQELMAIFSFAYQLHHFVQNNFIKFSKPLEDDSSEKTLLQLITSGCVYDCGEALYLLPPARVGQCSPLLPCFAIKKQAYSFKHETLQYTIKEKFYEKEQIREKEMTVELKASAATLEVKTSIKKSPSHTLYINYPLQSFLSSQQINHLIAWQILLLKSNFYKSSHPNVEDLQQQIAQLNLIEI